MDDDTNPKPTENSYTFISTTKNDNNDTSIVTSDDTVPMQDTGAPLVVGAIGILSILGGSLYSRRK